MIRKRKGINYYGVGNNTSYYPYDVERGKDGKKFINFSELKEKLIGKKIIKILEDEKILLEDGQVLELVHYNDGSSIVDGQVDFIKENAIITNIKIQEVEPLTDFNKEEGVRKIEVIFFQEEEEISKIEAIAEENEVTYYSSVVALKIKNHFCEIIGSDKINYYNKEEYQSKWYLEKYPYLKKEGR